MPEMYESSMNKIASRYDGDHDLPGNGEPLVTWTDMELLYIIQLMSKRIDELEKRFEDHHNNGPFITSRNS